MRWQKSFESKTKIKYAGFDPFDTLLFLRRESRKELLVSQRFISDPANVIHSVIMVSDTGMKGALTPEKARRRINLALGRGL